MRTKQRILMIVLLAAIPLLPGCTMIPKYERPKPPVPPEWNQPVVAGPPAGALAPEVPWRQFFTDPRLQQVIELALANNRDLRAAALNVERARAVYRIQRSDIYPDFGVLASANDSRLPEKMTDDGKAQTIEQYSVQVGILSWELDLFGRIRSLKRAALEQYLATREAQSAAQLSLVSAVGQAYLLWTADNESLRIARETLQSQTSAHDLITKSRDAGIASDLELKQAESQMEAARVDVARFEGLLALDRNALNLLAGTAIPPSLFTADGAVMQMKDVETGLSSEILLKRPDILLAEHQLVAANANIGAARAAFFPRITLTLGGGSLSPDLGSLLGSGTGTWMFAPQIVQPIYAGGLQRANLKVTKVDRELAVAQYEKAIQTAFREVSDALTLRDSLTAQLKAQQSLTDALQETYKLSNARYEAGIDSYLGVLVAQRALYVAQQGLIQLRQAEQANRVTLYKALGGGL